MMQHSEWLETTTRHDSLRAIGRTAGIPFRTITSQSEREAISAENVIKIAVAYDCNPVTALIDTGYLDEQWANATDPLVALRKVTEEQLAAEVLRRMRIGVETDALITPVDELAARHHSGSFNTNDGTVTQLSAPDSHLDYVAKRGTPEPEEGDDDYGDGA